MKMPAAIFALLFPVCCLAQLNDTTIVSTDSLSHEKRTVHYACSGISYSIDGIRSPKTIKRSITRSDALGRVIYKSYRETEFEGCIRNTKAWEIEAYEKSGASHRVKMKKKKFHYEDFNKSGKRLSKKDFPYFQLLKWMDAEETGP